MEQVRSGGPRRAGVWCGALITALAACTATAQAQPGAVPPPDSKPIQEKPRPLVIDKPVQVLTPPLPPDGALAPQLPVVDPAASVTKAINPLYEITTTFIILMFTAGGVAAMTVAVRFYFRLTMPTDLRTLARHDPWVRANLARLDAPVLKEVQVETDQSPLID